MTPLDLLTFVANLTPEQMQLHITILSPYDEDEVRHTDQVFNVLWPVNFNVWDDKIGISTITEQQMKELNQRCNRG